MEILIYNSSKSGGPIHTKVLVRKNENFTQGWEPVKNGDGSQVFLKISYNDTSNNQMGCGDEYFGDKLNDYDGYPSFNSANNDSFLAVYTTWG